MPYDLEHQPESHLRHATLDLEEVELKVVSRQSEQGRIAGIGVGGRATVALAATVLLLVGVGRFALERDAWGAIASIAAVILILHSLRIGVWKIGDRLLFRGWWRSVQVNPAAGERLVVEPYGSIWNWASGGGFLAQLAVEYRGAGE
jgi:hypothetical protein